MSLDPAAPCDVVVSQGKALELFMTAGGEELSNCAKLFEKWAEKRRLQRHDCLSFSQGPIHSNLFEDGPNTYSEGCPSPPLSLSVAIGSVMIGQKGLSGVQELDRSRMLEKAASSRVRTSLQDV